MARVTVEDCLDKVGNRFALVILAAERARQLSKGARALVRCDNKPAVTALREIADGKVKFNENVTEIRAMGDDRIDLRIDGIEPLKRSLGSLTGGDLARAHELGQFGRGNRSNGNASSDQYLLMIGWTLVRIYVRTFVTTAASSGVSSSMS